MQVIEAIVLKAHRLQEYSSILTLFSKERGIISLVATTRKQAFSQLLKVEAQFMPSEKELKKCKNIEIIGSYQALRLSLDKLQGAARMLDFVARELPPEEPVVELYDMLERYLDLLCETNTPSIVIEAFFREWKAANGDA